MRPRPFYALFFLYLSCSSLLYGLVAGARSSSRCVFRSDAKELPEKSMWSAVGLNCTAPC
jgi:hypothetical protein